MLSKLRNFLHVQMNPSAWPDDGLSPVNKTVTCMVAISILVVVLETEPMLSQPYGRLFNFVNLTFLVAFTVEYVIRVWVMGCEERYRGLRGMFRYILTWPALVDLIAILPFYFGYLGSDAFLIRIFRLLRILALAKIGKYSQALRSIGAALKARAHELFVSLGVALLIVFFASVLMYIAESTIQPDAFGSIPRALWWGVATLTTVGYGDVYPITPIGKIFAAVFAIGGIGLIALPTGVLVAAFGSALNTDENT